MALAAVERDGKRTRETRDEVVATLRLRVRREIAAAGFAWERDGLIRAPAAPLDKADIRRLHSAHRREVLSASAGFVQRWEQRVLPFFADGDEVDPERIEPRIVRVEGEGLDTAIFRYASLHWSIPVSRGYGRRTRFLLLDGRNDRLIGIFALGDPVFNLTARDDAIGWDHHQRSSRLYNVLDAFVLGAVPPYRQLLGAKLVAMAAASSDVGCEIRRKYQGSETLISKQVKHARPVLITATSALGRSSIYNRLKFDDRLLYRSVGFTKGYGHFQFSNETFRALCDLLREDGDLPDHEYGGGPNWRMRTLRLALGRIGLEPELLRHGIRRQVFLAPLARNWRSYLLGTAQRPQWHQQSLEEMAEHFGRRWAGPRALRDAGYRAVTREDMRLSRGLEG